MKLSPSATVDFYFIFSIVTAIGVVVSLYQSQKKSNKEDVTGIIKANIKLDSLCNSTDEIRMDMKDLNSKIDKLDKTQVKHDTFIAELREDIKDINKRVNALEKHGQ